MSAPNSSTPVSFIGYWSDIGRVRSENQDSYYVPPANLSQDQIRVNGYLCIVADGLGGQAGGAQASAMAVRRIVEEYYGSSNADTAASLTRAIQSANSQVFAAPTPGDGRMGTTIVAAAQVNGRITIANVGDSRAYLISDGRATQITRDHSRVQELIERGVLNADQAEAHEERSYITRAIGTQPQVQVDTFSPNVKPGDMIVLCCDGLWSQVRSEEIARTVSKYPPQVAAQRLVALANDAGGPDNITVVILPVLNEAGVVVPPPAKFPIPLPIAAGAVAALVLLLIAGFALLGGNNSQNGANQLAQSQTQTSVALAFFTRTLAPMLSTPTHQLPTLPISIPTSEPSATLPPEPSARITAEPSATNTDTPITETPTASPPIPPSATRTRVPATRTRTPTTVPTTVVPPQPSQPPSGTVYFPLTGGIGVNRLVYLFKMIDKPTSADWQEFCNTYPSIHCEPRTLHISGILEINSEDLHPITFEEMQKLTTQEVWLRMQMDDRARRGRKDDLEQMAKCYGGEWILVRALWNQEGFQISPPEYLLLFVWDGDKKAYYQRPLSC